MKRLKAFLSSRLPLRPVTDFLRQPLPGNVGWAHALGSALLFLLVIQVLTGGALLLYYTPTPEGAWASMNYASELLPGIAYVRSLHTWAASLLVLIATLHVLHTVIEGAYKRPRELNWVSGLASFLLIFAFLFTGRLLPWDQDGYWTTRLGLEMLDHVPWLGSGLQNLLQGGEEFGAFTLKRFFALHTFLLPGAVLALVGLHLVLLRHHGISDHPDPARRNEPSAPFFPRHAFHIATVAFVILWFLLTLYLVDPALLQQPADPANSAYSPRPEWYFLAYYELLRLFVGVEIVPVFFIPALLITAAILLPV